MVVATLRDSETKRARRIAADGVHLAAEAWGDPAAPPVLLLHGFGQTRHAWRDTGRRLAANGYHVIAPDARGHGESDRSPGGRYNLDHFVGDARTIADAMGGPYIVGASMGGLTGMLAEAESDHGLCRGLVLVDIAPRWRESGVARILEFMRARPEGFDDVADAARQVARYLPHREPRRTVEGLKPYLRRLANGRLVWHWDPALLEQVGADPSPYHGRLMAAARMLTCPALLINGEHSDVVSDAEVDEFLNAVPHADRVTIPGARHMVAGDDNDAFTDAVLAFLTGIEEPANMDRAGSVQA